MTKSELIEIISAKQKHLPAKDIELAVKQMLEIMSDALAGGERIEIRGFGSFSLHFRPPRQGRNPKTGETVALSGKCALHVIAVPRNSDHQRAEEQRDNQRLDHPEENVRQRLQLDAELGKRPADGHTHDHGDHDPLGERDSLAPGRRTGDGGCTHRQHYSV